MTNFSNQTIQIHNKTLKLAYVSMKKVQSLNRQRSWPCAQQSELCHLVETSHFIPYFKRLPNLNKERWTGGASFIEFKMC